MKYFNKNTGNIKPKRKMGIIKKSLLVLFALILLKALGLLLLFIVGHNQIKITKTIQDTKNNAVTIVMPSPTLLPVPNSKILPTDYHIFQTFNNCGPAALSMALSYYGINKTQAELGNELRPFQIPGGDNDDKSVTLEELSEKSKEYGFVPIHRPMGNAELIKLFIEYDLPVIARTWTKPNEDIGHYRIIKGYDDARRIFIQDDSLQNKNLEYTYADFNEIWKKFNYEYLVLVPKDKQEIADAILGENADVKTAWQNAVENSENELRSNPNDIYARFNLSVAYYNIGNYKQSTQEFEKVESQLPFRTLWYQIEPIQAYYELGNYDRVFEITDRVLNNYNRAFSELYILRGEIYKQQGNIEAAKIEFEKAVFYNTNSNLFKEALESI